jgi:tetratricopeptide (TPR) repeat protein
VVLQQNRVGGEIGERLRELRLARGMSQKELADPRFSPSYVSTIEGGTRRPSQGALKHFASKLGVDPEELATGRPADLEARLRLQLQEARIAVSAGRVDEAERSFRRVEEEASRFDLLRVQSAAIRGRALCAEERGNLRELADLCELAARLLDSESELARVDAVTAQARALFQIGELHHGAYLLEALLEVLERKGLRDPEALLKVRALLAMFYLDLGLLKKANESAVEALRLAPAAHEDEGLAYMYYQVSRTLYAGGRFDEALESVRKAEDLYRRLDLRTEVGRAHLAKGYYLVRRGDYERAREALEFAQEIFEAVDSPIDLAYAIDEFARIKRLTGEYESAIPLLQRCLELLPIDDLSARAMSHRELGLCNQGLSDYVGAEDNFRKAIDLFRQCDKLIELAATHRMLGDLLVAKGETEEGYKSYREGILAVEKTI